MMDKLKSLIGIILIISVVPLMCASAFVVMFFYIMSYFPIHYSTQDAVEVFFMIFFIPLSCNVAILYTGFDLLKVDKMTEAIKQLCTNFVKILPMLFISVAFFIVYTGKTYVNYYPVTLCLASGIALLLHKINIYFRYLVALLIITFVISLLTIGYKVGTNIYNTLSYINILSYTLVISVWGYMSYFRRDDLLKVFLYTSMICAVYIINSMIVCRIERYVFRDVFFVTGGIVITIAVFFLIPICILICSGIVEPMKLFYNALKSYIYLIIGGIIVLCSMYGDIVSMWCILPTILGFAISRYIEYHKMSYGRYIAFFTLFATIIVQGIIQDKALRAKGKKDNSIPQIQQQQEPQQFAAPTPQVQQQELQQFDAPTPQVQQQQAPQQSAVPVPQVQQQQSQVVCNKNIVGTGCSATCYKMYNDCIAQGGGAESCAQSIANIIPANAKPSSNCICPTCNNTWNKRW